MKFANSTLIILTVIAMLQTALLSAGEHPSWSRSSYGRQTTATAPAYSYSEIPWRDSSANRIRLVLTIGRNTPHLFAGTEVLSSTDGRSRRLIIDEPEIQAEILAQENIQHHADFVAEQAQMDAHVTAALAQIQAQQNLSYSCPSRGRSAVRLQMLKDHYSGRLTEGQRLNSNERGCIAYISSHGQLYPNIYAISYQALTIEDLADSGRLTELNIVAYQNIPNRIAMDLNSTLEYARRHQLVASPLVNQRGQRPYVQNLNFRSGSGENVTYSLQIALQPIRTQRR